MGRVGITHRVDYTSFVFDVARNLMSVSIRDLERRVRQEAGLEASDPFLRAQKIMDRGKTKGNVWDM